MVEVEKISSEDEDIEVNEEESQRRPPVANVLEMNNNHHPTWNGQRLFPPRVWKFGGFYKDRSGRLNLENTVCGICGKEDGFIS